MFDKEELEHQLGRLESREIVDVDVDLKNHRIEFKIIDHWGEESKPRQLVFGDVASFYYVAGRYGSSRFDKPINEMLELSTIVYTGGNLDQVEHSWFNPHKASIEPLLPNFLLEIWSELWLIEARTVEIDGKLFEVGYPHEAD